MSRYAFALKPKWIFGHVIVVVLIIVFVNAGLWQKRRLDERRAFNTEVAANMQAPVAPIDDVLPQPATAADVKSELDRNVSATGRYLRDQELVINAQASPTGIPGVWIVSPLLLDDGRVLLVNRGWLPSTGPLTHPPDGSGPPDGEVRVTGLLSTTETKMAGQSDETDGGDKTSFLRIDVARIQEQFSRRLVPGFLLRQSQEPADPGKRPPENLDPPELSDGPHLSYTIQWFSFTAMALIGYPLLLWFVARDRERKKDGDDADRDDSRDRLPPGAFIDDDGILDMTGVDDLADVDPRIAGADSVDAD